MKVKLDKNKTILIALFGESGSGKDTLQNILTEGYPDLFHNVVTHTTRPKRDKEKEGIDYHFVDTEQFAQMILDGSLVEATVFNNWGYGTSEQELKKDKINIGVLNPSGYSIFNDIENIQFIPIYILRKPKDRLLGCLQREQSPNCNEICRRFLSDRKDFDVFLEEYGEDILIYNNQSNPQNFIEFIEDNIELPFRL